MLSLKNHNSTDNANKHMTGNTIQPASAGNYGKHCTSRKTWFDHRP